MVGPKVRVWVGRGIIAFSLWNPPALGIYLRDPISYPLSYRMKHYLPLSLFLPLSISAQAQHTDTLASRRVAVQVPVADSLGQSISELLSGRLISWSTGDRQPKAQIIHSANLQHLLPLQEQLRQIAGVQATPYSGAPGAQVAVRIRGAASLSANAQPLYVVDGVPVFQNTFRSPSSAPAARLLPAEVAELDVNPLLSIPSEDIAQVQVLKGALETAQYGFQGLNGVIRITTKRGNTGPLRVRYSGYGGVQQARQRYELLDAQQYASLANEVALRYSRPAPFSPSQLAGVGRGTDWQEELLRTAAVQQHHLSADGGFANTRYYLGADYLNQQGVVLNSHLSRYALRANLDQQVGRLRLDAHVGLSQTRQRLPAYYALPNALQALPTEPVLDASGRYTNTSLYFGNPVQLALENYLAPQQRRLLAQLGFRYELLRGFTLDVRGNLERATLDSKSYVPTYPNSPGGQNGDYHATYQQWVLNPALRYARSFGAERHVVRASLEAQPQHRSFEEENNTYSPGGQYRSQLGSTYETNVAAYLLTGSYTFAGRYELQGSLRRDGSISFILDDRWQWLPGAQATWHAGQEGFLQSSTFVSRLDVWAGWGRTSGAGNTGRNSFYLSVPGQGGIERIPVPLRETTQQLETGLTLGVLGNHLNLTLGAYSRRTTPFDYDRAFIRPDREIQVRNTGLELSLDGSWRAGPVESSTSLAAAVNRNRYQQPGSGFYSASYHRTTDGQPLSTFYGARYAGVDANGQAQFQDLNGDGNIGFPDLQPLGSGLPRQLLSLTQQLTWKRLSLQAQLDGMFGYQVNNTSLYSLDVPSGNTNASTRVLDRWTPTHTATDVPAAGNSSSVASFPATSTYTLQAGNHLRLTSLTLSYKLWEKEVRSVSVWAGSHNLFVLTKYRGYDPNVSSAGSDNQQAGLDAGAYPTPRTVLLGLRATL